jgi:hypothetical protein
VRVDKDSAWAVWVKLSREIGDRAGLLTAQGRHQQGLGQGLNSIQPGRFSGLPRMTVWCRIAAVRVG